MQFENIPFRSDQNVLFKRDFIEGLNNSRKHLTFASGSEGVSAENHMIQVLDISYKDSVAKGHVEITEVVLVDQMNNNKVYRFNNFQEALEYFNNTTGTLVSSQFIDTTTGQALGPDEVLKNIVN
ncbi:MAG: hypothetical protein ABIA04_13565 [Pseudomonadota bacterium]